MSEVGSRKLALGVAGLGRAFTLMLPTFAADPRIDQLRAKMTVVEEPRYSLEFQDPEKRSSPNASR